MEFVNNNEDFKLRHGDREDCYWTTVKNGDKVEMTEKEARKHKLTPVIKATTGKIGKTVVETKRAKTKKKAKKSFKK